MEENLKKEDVEKVNLSKEKNNKKQKIITIIAVIVILFLGVNTFAATQGYNNIFFIISNLVSPERADSKDEILLDRDITISYQPIKISNDLNIQINKLIVKDDETTLYLDVTNNSKINKIANYVVYDITDGKKELIGNQMASEGVGDRYIEEIKLSNFSNTTKVLQLEIFDKNHNKMTALEINLDKKEINILEGLETEIEKISEVELKEFLSKVVRFNFYKDKDAITKYHTEQEYKDEMKVLYALELLDKENASFKDIHKVMKEFTGENIEKPLSVANVVVTKTENEYKYTVGKDAHQANALCLQISDIKYSDGIYTVSCVYTYITDEAYKNNTIENLDKFETTIEFTLNENYEYVKYCLVDADGFNGDLYKVDIDTEIDNEISEENKNENNNNESENSSNNKDDNINKEENKVPESNNTAPINPNNQWNESEDAIPGNSENSASSIDWNTFFTPGLRGEMPTGWNIKEFINGYSGPEDDGKLAKSVSGTITGIDSATNKKVTSNIIINFYMPEFIDVLDTETYTRIVASRYNMEASWAGYTSPDGMDWKMVVKENDQREFFCHLEPLAGDTEGIGYVVEVISDNFDNDKLINVIYRIFMELRGASF